jgi:hypothetical protein
MKGGQQLWKAYIPIQNHLNGLKVLLKLGGGESMVKYIIQLFWQSTYQANKK